MLSVSSISPIPQRLRAATWIRVSTAEQATDGRAGVIRQRDSLTSIAAAKGYDVIRRFELIDVSGTATMHAPETHALIELIRAGAIDVVLTSEMSRLLRPDDLTSFEILDICKRHSVILDLGGTVHDFRSPEGFLSGGILALLGGHERMQMLKRVHQAKEAKRARGQHPGNHLCLPLGVGYDRAKEKYFYTDDVVAVVEAFRIMDEEGIRNLTQIARRTGIHPGNIRNVLRNPLYRGERVYSQCRDLTPKRVGLGGRQKDKPKIARAPEKVIRVRVFEPAEQAVSDERWFRVQNILRGIRENHQVFVAEHHKGNLLAGTGRCGYCGDRLYAKAKSQNGPGQNSRGHYICRCHHESATKKPGNRKCAQGWVRKEELDALTEAFVQRFLTDEPFVAAVIQQARAKQADKVVGIDLGEMLRNKLSDLERRDQRVLDGLEAGVLTPDEAKQRRARLAEERKCLLDSSEAGHIQEADAAATKTAAKRIAEWVTTWPKDGTMKDKKAFLQRLFAEIYFRGPTITAFRLSPGLVSSADGATHVAVTSIAESSAVRVPTREPSRFESVHVATSSGMRT